jgi:hypothetical protein
MKTLTKIVGYCANVDLMGIRSTQAHYTRMAEADQRRALTLETARREYVGTGATFTAYIAAIAKADADHAAAVAASKAQHDAEVAALDNVGGEFRTEEAAQEHLKRFPVLAQIAAIMGISDRMA